MRHGADEGTRTPNLLITNQLLYHIELRQPSFAICQKLLG